jgi:two-component system chemotaxis response regulator CheY
MTTSIATPATVLLVEDDRMVRQFFRTMLGFMRFGAVLEAENGREALERLAEAMVDLLITDLRMPVMDGFTLVRRVRAMPEHAGLPIVIVSGGLDDEDEARRVGADLFLGKPVLPEELHAAVEQLLPGRTVPPVAPRPDRLSLARPLPVPPAPAVLVPAVACTPHMSCTAVPDQASPLGENAVEVARQITETTRHRRRVSEPPRAAVFDGAPGR